MAQLLTAEEIRKWDAFTIKEEGIASIDLMERAAGKCVEWIKGQPWRERAFFIFCGKGNNGGDGLAIARLLLQDGYTVSTFVLENGKEGSKDFDTNLHRLQATPEASLFFLHSPAGFPAIDNRSVVIDALFGSGLNKPLQGLTAGVVEHINQASATVISIDLPSGLFIERSTQTNPVVQANVTLTFQVNKQGLLMQENAEAVGDVQVLDIGLHPDFLGTVRSKIFLLEETMVRQKFKPRQRFAHKGSFGHALIIGGSWGKVGAAVLATRACLSTGAGLTTAFTPTCGYEIMQTAAPEAMAVVDEEEKHLTALPDDLQKFSAIGIGPGMGTHAQTQHLLSFVLHRYGKPMVIDADGLNGLALNKDWLASLPPHSILTPHPKEFDRLFGDQANDFDRIETAKEKASDLNVFILVKGHHTFIACPDGEGYFNSTGNAGMAKGGSGDVLTGILTSLLAQQYPPKEAALLGVFIHGWAGDVAAEKFSKEAMLPTQTIDCLADVFKALNA